MKKHFSFLILLLSVGFSDGIAQTKQEMDSLHDYCYICTQNEHLIIKPPYTKKFAKELPFLAASALMLAGGLTMDALDETKPYTEERLTNDPLDLNSINAID